MYEALIKAAADGVYTPMALNMPKSPPISGTPAPHFGSVARPTPSQWASLIGPNTPHRTEPVSPPPKDPFDPTPSPSFGPRTTQMINQVQAPELDPSAMSLRPGSSQVSPDEEFALRARNAGQARMGENLRAGPSPAPPQTQPQAAPVAQQATGGPTGHGAEPELGPTGNPPEEMFADSGVSHMNTPEGFAQGRKQLDQQLADKVGPAPVPAAEAAKYPALAEAIPPVPTPEPPLSPEEQANYVPTPEAPTTDPGQEPEKTPLPPELASGSVPRAPGRAPTPSPPQVAEEHAKPAPPLAAAPPERPQRAPSANPWWKPQRWHDSGGMMVPDKPIDLEDDVPLQHIGGHSPLEGWPGYVKTSGILPKRVLRILYGESEYPALRK